MKVYTIDEINRYGLDYQALKDSLKLEFLERIFVRNGDFPKRFREEAIMACKECRQAALKSFLVETPFLITLWTEEKPVKESKIEVVTPPAQETPTPNKCYRGVPYSFDDSEELATDDPMEEGQMIVKRYRGITYEVPTPLPVISVATPKKRTYRGLEY